jgi:hypothetical protein
MRTADRRLALSDKHALHPQTQRNTRRRYRSLACTPCGGLAPGHASGNGRMREPPS